MQRALVALIVIAGAILAVLLVRRAMHARDGSTTTAAPPADLFRYGAELEPAGRPDDTAPLEGVLGLSLRDLEAACEGDEGALQRMQEAIASRPVDESVAASLAVLPGQCFEPPQPPGPCVWAAAQIESGGVLASAAWPILTQCPAGVAARFFDSPDAPALRVLEFVASRQPGSARLSPPLHLPARYASAVLELVDAPSTTTLPAGPGLGIRYRDPAASAALVQAYTTLLDARSRVLLAQALTVLDEQDARTLARTVCDSIPTLPSCVDGAMLERAQLWVDPASYVERHPTERAGVLDDLDACARGAPGRVIGAPASCLAGLATLDWGRARAVPHASTPGVVGVGDEVGASSDLESTLARFPSVHALEVALQSRRLLGAARPGAPASVTVASVMAAHSRAWLFHPFGGAPMGHALLARHLARLGGLDDVSMDEIPTEGTGVLALLGHATRLRARDRGETFAVTTTSDGDYYDLDAVAGLLNEVARARGADVRYLVVVDPVAEEAIVLGPPAELASAVADGLLRVPGSTGPDATGLPGLGSPNLPF